MSRPETIAIDGPAGAGKSTVARMLARRLGYTYIDTGAMYRSIALLAVQEGLSVDDQDAVAALARSARIVFQPDADGSGQRVFLNSEDVTDALRSPEIASTASVVSAIPGVRTVLVAEQRALGAQGGVVMEGRDIGSVVFPAAEVKVFLTASPRARAARRLADIQQRGNRTATLEDVRADQDERDRRDVTRDVSPLAAAADAVEIDSDSLSAEAVVDEILRIVDGRRIAA